MNSCQVLATIDNDASVCAFNDLVLIKSRDLSLYFTLWVVTGLDCSVIRHTQYLLGVGSSGSRASGIVTSRDRQRLGPISISPHPCNPRLESDPLFPPRNADGCNVLIWSVPIVTRHFDLVFFQPTGASFGSCYNNLLFPPDATCYWLSLRVIFVSTFAMVVMSPGLGMQVPLGVPDGSELNIRFSLCRVR
jgi:hypothetical protein